jgi:hypothetical protein
LLPNISWGNVPAFGGTGEIQGNVCDFIGKIFLHYEFVKYSPM